MRIETSKRAWRRRRVPAVRMTNQKSPSTRLSTQLKPLSRVCCRADGLFYIVRTEKRNIGRLSSTSLIKPGLDLHHFKLFLIPDYYVRLNSHLDTTKQLTPMSRHFQANKTTERTRSRSTISSKKKRSPLSTNKPES